MPVDIQSPLCRRYALAVADVTVGPSPARIADRLTAAGVRPINNVVDVTNYVMLEMGHPMHAFDAAKLAGPQIAVRLARAGERLTTLDGQTRTLDPSMLVIADRDRPIAIAGVMGGAASEVTGATTRIAIESAWFDPASVRAASKRLGLKTEASARFERGADLEAPVRALERTLALLAEIGAGRGVGSVLDVYPGPAAPKHVTLRRARLARLLGAAGEHAIPDREVERILSRLEFAVAWSADGWQVGVPSFRVDVSREADLIEEVGRHWGFNRIPATLPPLDTPPPAQPAGLASGRRARALLRGAGLQEAATFTFIEDAAARPFAGQGGPAAIANPLSEKFAALRPSLLPGLLDALVYNRRRESEAVRLFEIGSVFGSVLWPEGESQTAGWIMTGPRLEHWSGNEGPVDFFDAKGVAELLARARGLDVEAQAADEFPWYVRGRAARIVAGGAQPRLLGHVGQIRPDLVAARGLDKGAVYGGEFSTDARAFDAWARDLARRDASVAGVRPLPRFPSVVRDLSIVVNESLPAAELRGTIWANAPATLEDVRWFDRYQGQGVPAGHVSLSARLTFRDPDRTLTDVEVQRAVDAIVAALARAHGATLRGAAQSGME